MNTADVCRKALLQRGDTGILNLSDPETGAPQVSPWKNQANHEGTQVHKQPSLCLRDK